MSDANAHAIGAEFRTACTQAIKKYAEKPLRRRCVALLISWENPGLAEVPRETQDLGHVLQDKYDFEIETFKIPEGTQFSSQRSTADALIDFRRKNDEEGNLLLIYYGGHGDHDFNACYWVSGKHSRINWTVIQNYDLIQHTIADCLIILDSCYAGSAARGTLVGKKELLAATGDEYVATAERTPHRHPTFSRALIDILDSLAKRGTQFGTNEILARLTRNSLKLEHQPHLVPLMNESPTEPIILYPKTLNSMIPTVPSPRLYKILVSIRLSDDVDKRSSEEWAQWLGSQILPGFQTLELLGVFKSTSTIMLVAFPINIWGLLPRHPAFTALGEVSSDNLAPFPQEPHTSNGQVSSRSSLLPPHPVTSPPTRLNISSSFASASDTDTESLDSSPDVEEAIDRLNAALRGLVRTRVDDTFDEKRLDRTVADLMRISSKDGIQTIDLLAKKIKNVTDKGRR